MTRLCLPGSAVCGSVLRPYSFRLDILNGGPAGCQVSAPLRSNSTHWRLLSTRLSSSKFHCLFTVESLVIKPQDDCSQHTVHPAPCPQAPLRRYGEHFRRAPPYTGCHYIALRTHPKPRNPSEEHRESSEWSEQALSGGSQNQGRSLAEERRRACCGYDWSSPWYNYLRKLGSPDFRCTR